MSPIRACARRASGFPKSRGFVGTKLYRGRTTRVAPGPDEIDHKEDTTRQRCSSVSFSPSGHTYIPLLPPAYIHTTVATHTITKTCTANRYSICPEFKSPAITHHPFITHLHVARFYRDQPHTPTTVITCTSDHQTPPDMLPKLSSPLLPIPSAHLTSASLLRPVGSRSCTRRQHCAAGMISTRISLHANLSVRADLPSTALPVLVCSIERMHEQEVKWHRRQKGSKR